jgi:prepilin peptidase CpaA
MAAQILFYLPLVLFPAALAYAAVSDLMTLTIPNRLVLAIAGLFVVLAPFSGMDLTHFGLHLAAGGVVLLFGFVCFAFGWIGGGDAKLAAAIALFLGHENALAFIGLASVLGGALTLLLLAFRQAVVPVFIIRQPWVQRLHDTSTGVPYGIALSAAAALIYMQLVTAGVAFG